MSFCHYYDDGICSSCSKIELPYAQQIKEKQERLESALSAFSVENIHKPTISPVKAFRSKAKMAAIPTLDGVVLGLSSESPLIYCPLYSQNLQNSLIVIQSWLRELGIKGYDIRYRKGELKFVIVTEATSSDLMVRFVLRSGGIIPRLKRGLDELIDELPSIKVASVNIQPKHMAILEGEEEIFLTDNQHLSENFNGIPLYIYPRSFFQTNPTIAQKLYKTASQWIDETDSATIWDLFCGVGAFGLHTLNKERRLIGIEISDEAIECAKKSAFDMEMLENVTFRALDTVSFSMEGSGAADVIIVNPPRRGLGEQISKWLLKVGAKNIVYSSCNLSTLTKDLEILTNGYSIKNTQLFDMFAHSDHLEVLVMLEKV